MTEKKREDEAPKSTATGARKSTADSSPTEPEPLSLSLDPTSGPEHTAIVISGADFGDTPGTLALNEVPAPVVSWSATAISTIVPYGGKTGDLVVITADGRRGAASFTVTEKPA